MSVFVRDIPDGVRFKLCRTGQKYRLMRRERIKGRLRFFVVRDGESRESSLHHSCHVKLILPV